jgi:hypothetical protein
MFPASDTAWAGGLSQRPRKRPHVYESSDRSRFGTRSTTVDRRNQQSAFPASQIHNIGCTKANDCELVRLLRSFSKNADAILYALKSSSAASSIYASIASSPRLCDDVSLTRLRALFLAQTMSVCNVSPMLALLPESLSPYLLANHATAMKAGGEWTSRHADEAQTYSLMAAQGPQCLGQATNKQLKGFERARHLHDVIGIDVDVRRYLKSGSEGHGKHQIPDLDALTEALTVAFVATDGAILDTVEDHVLCFSHVSFCRALSAVLARPDRHSVHVESACHLIAIYCRTHLGRSVPWNVLVNDDVVVQLFLTSENAAIAPPKETALGSLCARAISVILIQYCLISGMQPSSNFEQYGRDDDVATCLYFLMIRIAWLLTRSGQVWLISSCIRSPWISICERLFLVYDALYAGETTRNSAQVPKANDSILICECGDLLLPVAGIPRVERQCCPSPNRASLVYPPYDKWIAWEIHVSILEGCVNKSALECSTSAKISVDNSQCLDYNLLKSNSDGLDAFWRKKWAQLEIDQASIFQAVLTGFFQARHKLQQICRFETTGLAVPQRVGSVISCIARFTTFSDISNCLDCAALFATSCNGYAPDGSSSLQPGEAKPTRYAWSLDSFSRDLPDSRQFAKQAILIALECLAVPTGHDGADICATHRQLSAQSRTIFLHKCESLLRWLVQPGDKILNTNGHLRSLGRISALAFSSPRADSTSCETIAPSKRRRFFRTFKLVEHVQQPPCEFHLVSESWKQARGLQVATTCVDHHVHSPQG